MQDLSILKDEDLQGLTPEAVTALAQQIQRRAQDIRLKHGYSPTAELCRPDPRRKRVISSA